MEAYMDVDSRLGGDLGGLLLSYTPLVRATAHRYMGRGAEFDDLVQEGYLALLLLIPRCGDREWLPLFLKSRLPGYVRAVAKKLRSGGGVFDLEEIEEVCVMNTVLLSGRRGSCGRCLSGCFQNRSWISPRR